MIAIMEFAELSLTTRAGLSALDGSVVGASSEDHEVALASVGTGLFWACALDEQLERVAGYKSERNQDGGGRLLPGLRLGRNAVAHGAAVIVLPAQGAGWPMSWPVIWKGASWAEYDVVRAGLDCDPSAFRRAIWKDDLAGANVPGTLTVVRDWLIDAVHRYPLG